MFIRLSTVFFSVAALAGVATAAPTALEARDGGGSTCNSGNVQCCSSVQDSSSSTVSSLLGSLGFPPLPGGMQVGVTCSPILGGSGSACTQQTVCCNGDSFSGLIVVGCSPITINVIL